MITQIHKNTYERTALIVEIVRQGNYLIQAFLVRHELEPTELALIEAGLQLPAKICEGNRRFDARDIAQILLEEIDIRERGIVPALIGWRFGHDEKHVGTRRVMMDQIRIVLVVGRIRPQFRRTGVEIADLYVPGHEVTADA